ncbi:hypothetical protein BBJ29_008530 [Phytophthora kernoviae]|uniref:Transmembrane protein n=1 Tax=Phytophthora kernoviae TaxID=325452 RepID=A0A3F2RJJ6_9STRA|nr:hypothetical protein BBJ29_008530 [Phytophthora kernoviae]RLN58555.1 hypothetical protein BBP00_00006933 [Phytophthora kernoviae]
MAILHTLALLWCPRVNPLLVTNVVFGVGTSVWNHGVTSFTARVADRMMMWVGFFVDLHLVWTISHHPRWALCVATLISAGVLYWIAKVWILWSVNAKVTDLPKDLKFLCSVFFQSLLMAWEGYTSDGQEKIPPLMLFGPASALYSVIALWPTFNGPRILLHYRRPAPCSWEILDWVFFEGSTTSTIVAFGFFWVVTLPYSGVSLPGLHAFGAIVQFIVVGVDFYFTAPLFKSNHVFLVLMWPVSWVFIQYLWVISGHQPTNDLFNFHSPVAPIATLMLFLSTVVVFYALLWYSRRLQHRSDEVVRVAVSTSEMDSDESSSCLTPTNDHASTAPFELVIDNRLDRSTFDSKASDIVVMHKPR